MPRPDPAEITTALNQFRYHSARLNGAADIAFPPGWEDEPPLAADVPQFPPGFGGEYPLKTITSVIDDVLASFDILQKAMGWPHEGRHDRFLRGKCGES